MKRRRNGRGVVRRVVRRLEQTYRPQRIILFGSYAENRQTKDSDIDLLIIKDTKRSFYQRLSDVRKVAEPVIRGYPFDPIVLTSRELEQRLARGDQFLQAIVTSGRPLHG